MKRGTSRLAVTLLGVMTLAVIVSFGAGAAGAKGPKPKDPDPAGKSACSLGKGGKIQHVIYLQFDNVHFFRDNPNVPSDLEQMPNLLKFLRQNGTLLTNDHTVLISHTGGGILASLTGLYPNRQGQAVSNSYGYFKPDGSVGFSSSFKYWTDQTDAGNPATVPPTPAGDPNFNMVNNDDASLGGTGAVRNAPAPWVPFTRAGCDVGNVGTANAVLENNNAVVFRSGPTTLAASAAVGATNIKVASVTGFAAGETITLDAGANLENAVVATVGTAGATGTGITLTAPLTKAHSTPPAGATGVTVYGPTATDPTGDMTKVFHEGSTEWNEGKASQLSNPGSAARNLAQTDFVGMTIHCAAGGGICNTSTHAKPDELPDEAGGYSGTDFKGLFGAKYVNPAINHGSACVDNTDGNPIQDQFQQCGFPGFDGMFPRNTLGEVAQMQEAGVPVTFAYISDAHDGHGVAGEIHHAYGPGEKDYVKQLADYDKSFGDFFTRLKNDGITKDNTLFVVTVEEEDHFAGTQPNEQGCDGLKLQCTYANVSEVNADLKRLVATYNASHGTAATTSFSVHSDMAPNVYITGNPARESATARTLEQAMSDMEVTNPYSGEQQNLFVAMADPIEENLLHMVTADPARTPTFTPFAQGDYFLSGSSTTPCANNDLNACLTTAVSNPNQSFAWNHGGIQPEIRSTWIGYVGPGVENLKEDDGPAPTAQDNDPGKQPFTDHTDIRPTMLSLLGLTDTYVSDGRVVTEILKGDVTPKSLNGKKAEELGQAYKQIMASFGDFSLDTLAASTAALASTSSGDSVYADTENTLKQLGEDRDAVANEIRLALWNAEFKGQKLDEKKVKGWIDQANDLLGRARDLAVSSNSESDQKQLGKIKHFVVIYEENHSFDNLFGGWEGVNGLNNVHQTGVGDHVTQVDQNGAAYGCLKQLDVNLTSPPLPNTCQDTTHGITASNFPNSYFTIDDFIKPTDVTCPPITNAFGFANGIDKNNPPAGARPGGCTRDLVHEYYQEQYQLHGGAQDHYMSGSDSAGTTMGVYDTTQLPLYAYLHEKGHPHYAIADDFFQAAFGGSFLNHQWLVAAATPVDPTGSTGGAHAGSHSIIDSNGMPVAYPLYTPTGPVARNPLTVACTASGTPPAPAQVCGNWAVNTMQPTNPPQGAFSQIMPVQTAATIGDRLTDAGLSWAWYSGGWANADGDVGHPGYTDGTSANPSTPSGCSSPTVDTGVRAGVAVAHWPRCPDALFQYHHQPFAYFANYAPGTPGRAHLQDEADFAGLVDGSAKKCQLGDVSFVKPIGEENEHPGYASTPDGNTHLTATLRAIEGSACAKDTMVIVTYDEFGGQWDHVPPPGQGNNNGPHDVWGPGTRIPTLVIAPHLKGDFVVDSTEHDTTSILATLEHRYGLAPLGSRDAAVGDMSSVFDAKKPKGVH